MTMRSVQVTGRRGTMRSVLVTGRRGTGKTTVLRDLVFREHRRVTEVLIIADCLEEWADVGGECASHIIARFLRPGPPRLLVIDQQTFDFKCKDLRRLVINSRYLGVGVLIAVDSTAVLKPEIAFNFDMVVALREPNQRARDLLMKRHFGWMHRPEFDRWMDCTENYCAVTTDATRRESNVALFRAEQHGPFQVGWVMHKTADLRELMPARASAPDEGPAPEEPDQRLAHDVLAGLMARHAPDHVRKAARTCRGWRHALDDLPWPVELVHRCAHECCAGMTRPSAPTEPNAWRDCWGGGPTRPK